MGTIGKEERPPQGQLWMEQYLISLAYLVHNMSRSQLYLAILADSIFFGQQHFGGLMAKFHLLKLLSFFWLTYCSIGPCFSVRV